ncbi:MAG: DJ-1/PfpI family protein [Alphaproteobacteria bacterium]|nr:DJ-1/PfpI family protein [Alphaproteobacteria bacterium]MBU0794359.1 DJ-1/PfpI family protein [Alphaproteobacteria bacterium]MBU0875230.1 DJ-1/PfpI family protein [Alphaproteobacteria bacterium]MBU1768979.1 DJ-1/PfpI family protein [Alphaproteobacteria bacterium]
MTLDRRTVMASFAGAVALAPFLAIETAMARAGPPASDPHDRLTAVPGLKMHGDEQVAMLLYPGFTALDLVGPHYFFASMMGATVHLVTNGVDLAPVASDLGLAIAPTMRMADAPRDLTVLFVPGGSRGTATAMRDRATIDFIADRGVRAKHITSVCTGSMLLGAAGLLRGKRATSHWVARPVLAEFGATAVDARVVTDGNVTTGAGVSAGLDFALALVAQLRGRPYAEALMLQAEYAPEPPFPGGTLATTPQAVADGMAGIFAPLAEQYRAAARALR